MTYSYNETLNNNENEWTITSHNVHEWYKHIAEQKKPNTECMQYHSIHNQFQNQAK